MVKFISFFTLSTLIIAPTFASELWDLKTRDVSIPHLFGRELGEAEAAIFARDMETLFARQHSVLERRGVDENNVQTDNAYKPHAPPKKHELVERDFDDELFKRDLDDDGLFEREFDEDELYIRNFTEADLFERDFDEDEVYIRDLTEADLFERFYDDLD